MHYPLSIAEVAPAVTADEVYLNQEEREVAAWIPYILFISEATDYGSFGHCSIYILRRARSTLNL